MGVVHSKSKTREKWSQMNLLQVNRWLKADMLNLRLRFCVVEVSLPMGDKERRPYQSLHPAFTAPAAKGQLFTANVTANPIWHPLNTYARTTGTDTHHQSHRLSPSAPMTFLGKVYEIQTMLADPYPNITLFWGTGFFYRKTTLKKLIDHKILVVYMCTADTEWKFL